MMSNCKEEDDEHTLDYGKDGCPQQENMDQGILGRLCHPDGRA